MKKILALLLVLMLLVSTLTGCSNKSSDLSNSSDVVAETPRATAQTAYHTAAESFAGGSGTEDDPFQISEAGHLVLLHEMLEKEYKEINFDDTYVKGHFILTADVALNDITDFENWSTTAPEYGWEPIGIGAKDFEGVFDGNGHKIIGMFIDADGVQTESVNDYYGLFSRLGGTVKNLTVEQSYIRVSGNTTLAGTVAGSTNDAVIENCSADTIIELYSTIGAGGITGSGGDITGCAYSGSITQLDDSFANIGGIVGSGGSIQDCTFTGSLSGNGHTGGIVGYGGNVKNSVNKGTISGDTAGGISGRVYAAGTNLEIENPKDTIENCTNEGQVTGTAVAGGIVGWLGNDESDISMSVINCENKGQVSSDKNVAGIIGKVSVERSGMIKVENCVNHVNIFGKGKTGGVISEVLGAVLHQEGDLLISNCKNLGSVTSEDQYSAGVVGYLLVIGNEVDLRVTVENCANEGAIQSAGNAGGILGFSNVGFNAEVSAKEIDISDTTHISLRSCTNNGSVTVTTNNSAVGGIVGVWGLGYIPSDITDCVNNGVVKIDFTLTDEQIAEQQNMEWTEFYQIAGGIVGRLGDGLKLTTAEGVETSADNVNAKKPYLVISGCNNIGMVSVPDHSFILNKWGKPLYMNYLGGVVGQTGTTNGYAFKVENCTYSGFDRGLGNEDLPDVGTKK